ncbi:hypothetical protein CLOLEP_02010 [[Clostridium] leptum DSM 753]|uniref:Uncharacterized protein n=1 Tax=[Clostridium] leptum DSM 753 TaxID=428125 RepID=A7VTW6_9FIRM|nr:hypothetical protein CLOLEP_02010 [[Clostridium] leptum DSM 753]
MAIQEKTGEKKRKNPWIDLDFQIYFIFLIKYEILEF